MQRDRPKNQPAERSAHTVCACDGHAIDQRVQEQSNEGRRGDISSHDMCFLTKMKVTDKHVLCHVNKYEAGQYDRAGKFAAL